MCVGGVINNTHFYEIIPYDLGGHEHQHDGQAVGHVSGSFHQDNCEAQGHSDDTSCKTPWGEKKALLSNIHAILQGNKITQGSLAQGRLSWRSHASPKHLWLTELGCGSHQGVLSWIRPHLNKQQIIFIHVSSDLTVQSQVLHTKKDPLGKKQGRLKYNDFQKTEEQNNSLVFYSTETKTFNNTFHLFLSFSHFQTTYTWSRPSCDGVSTLETPPISVT